VERAACRSGWPPGCIIDSQIVKCADTVGKATSGYHGGKKITGRGRHLIVDTEGWPLALAVTAASISDKAGARLVTARLVMLLATLKVMWADTGYNGAPLRDWMLEKAGITLEIVARTSPHSFQVLKRRWVLERTFGWFMRYRRLARDYERSIEHYEAMIWWATVFIMTRRLTWYETRQTAPPRWGGERGRPAQQAALSTGSYRDALAVADGTGPFTWSVTGGSLPAGLTLNSSTGVLSGTPSAVSLERI
jgi:transposase